MSNSVGYARFNLTLICALAASLINRRQSSMPSHMVFSRLSRLGGHGKRSECGLAIWRNPFERQRRL